MATLSDQNEKNRESVLVGSITFLHICGKPKIGVRSAVKEPYTHAHTHTYPYIDRVIHIDADTRTHITRNQISINSMELP